MADTFTPEQITQILEEFFKVVGTRKYIGERYVPIFGRKGEESIQWDNSAPYEPLTIVLYQGNSYTSRQYVPIGVEITNQEFWVITGNYNAQVEAYHRETITAREIADNAITTANNAITTANNAQNDIDTLLPKADFSAENTVKKYIDENPTRILTFDTVADMQAATNLLAGMTCHTNGFHASGDGGAAYYKVSASGTANGMDVLALQDGLFATLVITESYVTPEMFGAHGDGEMNDTISVRTALKYAIDNSRTLFIFGKYYVTESLLTSEDYSNRITVNIQGRNPEKRGVYVIDSYGGIRFDSGLYVFDGITISGSIRNVCFAPSIRTQTGAIFHGCTLSRLVFDGCSVANVLAFCHNTTANSVSKITNSTFLTVYYFAKCDTAFSFTDSIIQGNYINGGAELTANHCFEWSYFNGSSISGNFIDYYQTIYYPVATASRSFQGGISEGNQYQVFRYLYFLPANISSFYFTSIGDCFNWTDPTKLQKLSDYDAYTYVGHDSNTYDIPPAIMIVYEKGVVHIENPVLQNNLGNLIFIYQTLTGYKYGSAEWSGGLSVANTKYDYASCVTHTDEFYNNGNYKLNMVRIPFVLKLDSLPSVTLGWSNYYLGQLVSVNNAIYRLVAVYDTSNSTWGATWVDVTAQM